MEKDKKSAVIGVILSICILVMWNLMLAEPVHASEGSLLIEAHYKKDDGTSIPIPRDYYSIYKVAHEEKDAYTNVSPFQDFPLIERESTNSEKNQLVHSLEEYVTSRSQMCIRDSVYTFSHFMEESGQKIGDKLDVTLNSDESSAKYSGKAMGLSLIHICK